jgi:hypothetical protein
MNVDQNRYLERNDGGGDDPGAAGPPYVPTDEDKKALYEAYGKSLEAVRESSQKWNALLSTLTGLLGVTSFVVTSVSEIDVSYRIAVVIFLALALVALVVSYIAVFPEPIQINDTNLMGFASRLAEAKSAAAVAENRKLKLSQKSTVIGIFVIAVASGITMFAPLEKSD